MVKKLSRESTRSATNQRQERAEGTKRCLEQSEVAEEAEQQERQRSWWKPSLSHGHQSHRQTHTERCACTYLMEYA